MKITEKVLNDMDACPSGIRQFKLMFPAGQAAWEEIVESYTVRGRWDLHEDLVWFAQRCPSAVTAATWAARLNVIGPGRLGLVANKVTGLMEYGSRKDCAALGWYCPADVAGATWKARLDVQLNDDSRALLACYCPADVAGATWKDRVMLTHRAADRLTLGVNCPVEVAGATWEARIAIQLNDYYKACFIFDCPNNVEGSDQEKSDKALDAILGRVVI